jgi:glycosyltransferase involved in cell wall biosynthesis
VLRHAIASALGQTWPALEVIVAGDGCTDDSEAVVAAAGDQRVRWLGLAENSGSQSAPNNAAVAAARGKYVAYHGHDDVWHPDHLRWAVGALERTGAAFGYTAGEMIGPVGSNIRVVTGDLAEGGPASVIVHRRDLVDAIGGWRDYRTMVDPPDVDLCRRAHASGLGVARARALTVYKFNSAWRRDVYRVRPSHEQAAYRERIAREGRAFMALELARVAWARRFGPPPVFPEFSVPDGVPGARVAAWRRFRGLD